jgi:hypothetical protein
MSYDNSNSGFIGKNTRKETDKHPDLSGSCEVGGVQYWISGWRNSKGYGLRFNPKDAKAQAPKPQPKEPQGGGFVDDSIPF